VRGLLVGIRPSSCPGLSSIVIAGLDPAIHTAVPQRKSIMDHRVTPLDRFAICAAAR
jgi:hypothetical protein